MKPGFLDKLIERMDRIDPGNLQAQFLRLAGEKGFLETIFQAIQEGIIVLDGASRIVYANQAAGKFLGVSMESATGQPLQRYLRGIEWERLLKLDEAAWSKLASHEIEVTYPEHRFLNMYVVPLSTVKPRERGAVVILRDITRDREQEAHTIESERLNALMLLAAGVAHEIGNPLNSLNIHLQLMERSMGQLPESHRQQMTELLGVARNEVSRLDQILSQFLRAIRPTQPKFEHESVLDVVKDTLDFLKHEIKDRDILVETESPDHAPTAYMDRNQIRQAFFNVIRNAIQAMPNGGLLKITLSSADRFTVISFKDTGPGIAADDMGSIFNAFHTTKTEGSGLGLMIVQRIVRDHGGQIEVHSEPNKGTTFAIMLPRDEQRVRLLKAARATSAPAQKEGHEE
ncbi:MAG: ATP-binding protein [Lentisphaerota bacterium]